MIGGKESFTKAFEIDRGVPIQIPMIDIRTIGGSIVWINTNMIGALRSVLRCGQAILGPALIEEEASVTVLDRGHRLRPDPAGHPLIDVMT